MVEFGVQGTCCLVSPTSAELKDTPNQGSGAQSDEILILRNQATTVKPASGANLNTKPLVENATCVESGSSDAVKDSQKPAATQSANHTMPASKPDTRVKGGQESDPSARTSQQHQQAFEDDDHNHATRGSEDLSGSVHPSTSLAADVGSSAAGEQISRTLAALSSSVSESHLAARAKKTENNLTFLEALKQSLDSESGLGLDTKEQSLLNAMKREITDHADRYNLPDSFVEDLPTVVYNSDLKYDVLELLFSIVCNAFGLEVKLKITSGIPEETPRKIEMKPTHPLVGAAQNKFISSLVFKNGDNYSFPAYDDDSV
jgi:hypothetical protein